MIPAKGHTEEVVPGKAATCTETGLTDGVKCSVCGETLTEQEVIPALGHKFDEKTTEHQATEADCCHLATYYYTCSNENCDEVGTETFEHGQFDADNHKGDTEVRDAKAATEYEEGYTGDTYCLGCGAMIAKGEVIEKLDHTHDMVKTEGVEATCTEAGNIEYWTCTKCGKTYADADGIQEVTNTVIKALGHNYIYESNNDATCTEDGTETGHCSRCDATDTRKEEGSALGHTEETVPGKAATCTETGLTDGTKCSVCGEILVAQEEIPALGHTEEVVPGKEATCTETGLTDGTKCSVCGETLVAQEEIPALGHGEMIYVEDKDPTCSEIGYHGHWTCPDCNKYYADAEGTEELPVEEVEIPTLDHTWGEWIVTEEPDCTNPGSKTRKCSACEDEETEEIPANGHEWSEWNTIVEATQDTAGEEERVCSVCGEKETRVIPKVENPDTGDEFQFVTMMVLMLVSATGMAALLIAEKKRARR